MKNKYLVLIFLVTVVVGLLARRFPWRMPSMFQTALIELDTTAVTQISIVQAGAPELMFERTDKGWMVSQNDRSFPVSPDALTPMLAALTYVQSLRVIPTKLPDSLGLGEQNGLQVSVYEGQKQVETFTVGRQVLEKNDRATYILLDQHEGVYLVKDHLRDLFLHKLEDFRINTIARFDPIQVTSIGVNWRSDSTALLLQKNDSLHCWQTASSGHCIPDDSLQTWLQWMVRLQGLPFADDFDDSRLLQTLHTELTIETAGKEPIILQVHNPAAPGPTPENHAAKWVLHSSQNPLNYFYLNDTSLARRILHW